MTERISWEERRERVNTGHAPSDTFVEKCMDNFLRLRLKEMYKTDDKESRFLKICIETFGIESEDTTMGEIIEKLGTGGRRPLSDELHFLCQLMLPENRKEIISEKARMFMNLPVEDVVHMIKRLPLNVKNRIFTDDPIASMDLDRSYAFLYPYFIRNVRIPEKPLTIGNILTRYWDCIISFHDDMPLLTPWNPIANDNIAVYYENELLIKPIKALSTIDDGIYFDAKEKDESIAATIVWMLCICLPYCFMKTKSLHYRID